jgi:hypothetical protein
MADEGEKFLEKAVIWLQRQQEKLTEGFSIQFQGQEYSFVVEFIDRLGDLFFFKSAWLCQAFLFLNLLEIEANLRQRWT